ncbi:MAG: hypothetical protein CSB48_07765 [Proteobacteria bacterium]|nr:MAG: hypothetical protein CSB48_07765 [Pseudomonadota bacterium]
MCLIVFAYRYHPEFELIMAGNRDEFFHRPSRSAFFWGKDNRIYAGRDEEQGGTWFGVNKSGHVSAVTNYRKPGEKDYPCSRGHLVSDFLDANTRCPTYTQGLTMQDYAGFNLVLKDAHGMYYLSNRLCDPENTEDRTPGAIELKPGIYGLSNHLLDTPWPKVEKSRLRFSRIVDTSIQEEKGVQTIWTEIAQLFTDSQPAPKAQLPQTGVPRDIELLLSPIFIKGHYYGTRATTLVTVSYKGKISFFEQSYAPGGQPDNFTEQHFDRAP